MQQCEIGLFSANAYVTSQISMFVHCKVTNEDTDMGLTSKSVEPEKCEWNGFSVSSIVIEFHVEENLNMN